MIILRRNSTTYNLTIITVAHPAARSDTVLTPVQSEEKAIEAFTKAEHPADLINYGERAWCRLELFAHMCSNGFDHMYLLEDMHSKKVLSKLSKKVRSPGTVRARDQLTLSVSSRSAPRVP